MDLSGFVDWKGGGWLSVLSVAESCALIFISALLLCRGVGLCPMSFRDRDVSSLSHKQHK